jgi:PAS domain S-box-containing protein
MGISSRPTRAGTKRGDMPNDSVDADQGGHLQRILLTPARAVHFSFKNPLGRRVTAWMLACTVGLASISTAIQLFTTFQRDVEQIAVRLEESERSSVAGLAFAVWNHDRGEMKSQLAVLLTLPDVAYAQLVDTQGHVLATVGTRSPEDMVRSLPVLLDRPQAHQLELGRLTMAATLDGIYARLHHEAMTTLAGEAGEAFCISFMMLLIFRKLVSQPLSTLAGSAQRMDLGNLSEPIELKRTPHVPDEFDTLVHALNAMRSSLKREVDELQTARRALSLSEERYRNLVESTNVVGWEFDVARERIDFIGPQIVDLLGYPCETWYEHGFTETNTEAGDLAHLRVALKQQELDLIDLECRLLSADGRTRWFSVLANRHEASSGAKVWQGHLIDIDARKRSELELALYRDELELRVVRRTTELHGKVAELEDKREEQRVLIGRLEMAQSQAIQSEKLASIGQLAAGVAHEINNPVGFVLSNFNSLERYVKEMFGVLGAYEAVEPLLPQDDPSVASLRQAKAASDIDFIKDDIHVLLLESRDGLDRVKRIVQDLKDFSHVGGTQWQRADLIRGLESTLNVVRNEIKYKADIVRNFADLPEVDCVPSQLNQVFMNLLVNAAHAIEGHGTITLGSGVQDKQVWIEIGDSGSGIAPEVLNRIFDPFFTTKPVGQGTGLGLSLSYSIVRQHGGRIEVSSTLGAGTIFRVWLPIEQPEMPALAEAA